MNARVQSCYCWQWKGFFLFSFGTFTVSSRRKKSDLNIWRQECHLEAHVLLFGSLNFVLREENCWCVILWTVKTPAWVMSSSGRSPSPRGLWLPVPAHLARCSPLLHEGEMPQALQGHPSQHLRPHTCMLPIQSWEHPWDMSQYTSQAHTLQFFKDPTSYTQDSSARLLLTLFYGNLSS